MALVELSPGDSVSCASEHSVSPINLDLSKIDLAGTVLTVEGGLKYVEKTGVENAVFFAKFFENQQAFINRCLNVQFGAIRSASSSVASSLSGTSSGGVSGLTGARMQKARAAAALDRNRRKKVPDGLCYSKLLKTKSMEACVQKLGEWPAMVSVLRAPASSFQSLDELERFRLVGDRDTAHVAAGGSDGFSFLASASRLAATVSCPRGSFGAVLAADGRGLKSSPLPGVHARTLIGGLKFQDVGEFVPTPAPSGGTGGERGELVVDGEIVEPLDLRVLGLGKEEDGFVHVVTLPPSFWTSAAESSASASLRVRAKAGALCMTVLRERLGGAYAFVLGSPAVAWRVAAVFEGVAVDPWVDDEGDLAVPLPSGSADGVDTRYSFYSVPVGAGREFSGSELDLVTRVGFAHRSGKGVARVLSKSGWLRAVMEVDSVLVE